MTRATILASDLKAKGQAKSEPLSPSAAVALASGAGSSINPKLWPNEDSLTLAQLDDGSTLAAVADAHWGGSASEAFVRDLVSVFEGEQAPTVVARLFRTILRLEAAYAAGRAPDDRSETTLLVVHLQGGQLSWVNVGDSLLVRVGTPPAQLNQPTPFFVGNAPLASVPMGIGWTQGSATLAPGERVLLASDGLEPNASGLTLGEVNAIVAAEGPALERVEALLTRAGDVSQGGGRDNLALALFGVG